MVGPLAVRSAVNNEACRYPARVLSELLLLLLLLLLDEAFDVIVL